MSQKGSDAVPDSIDATVEQGQTDVPVAQPETETETATSPPPLTTETKTETPPPSTTTTTTAETETETTEAAKKEQSDYNSVALTTTTLNDTQNQNQNENENDDVEETNQDEPVTLSFSELNYIVDVPVGKMGLWEKIKGFSLAGFPTEETKELHLLKNVTGTMRPKTMTALMGPSGAGKSTLLDVLAHRKNTGTISGDILVNGEKPDVSFKRLIGYVEQQDILLHTLTPTEVLFYSAIVRLPSSLTTQDINHRVELVIEELGLQTCKDTMIGNENVRGISGGQAKRVNIGVELITRPRVLFLVRIYIYIYMYVCMYVCIYVYMYVETTYI